MSDFKRLLSRREKRSHTSSTTHGKGNPAQAPPKKEASHFYGVFTADHATKKPDKEEEKKIKAVQQKFNSHEVHHITESQAEFALRMKLVNGDVDKAEDLLNLFQRSWEGLVVEPKSNTKVVGAENREKVTCYLDALLFAMFARLRAFQPILYVDFDDEPRRKLSGLLRLWVNMLRSGMLITTDITKRLQEALANCGWNEAVELHQQDASEAFTFITDKLQLPLLTLKMDIFHHGKEEAQDDHKFVNERLLNVAIPDDASNGVITLEECLEHYFNNRIEVKRYLQRRHTLQPAKGLEDGEPSSLSVLHVETKEIEPQSPAVDTPTTPTTPATPLRPVSSRARADSIFSQTTVEQGSADQTTAGPQSLQRRKSSIRREVNMPAWQFFSLIPWYTDHAPRSDAQVAAHFSEQRPMLGICLKRYKYTEQGSTIKLATRVLIPQEIPIPPFVSDDTLDANGPVFGNFKLVLQSVVCHRGATPDSGHYISLVRGRALNASSKDSDIDDSSQSESPCEWMLFDDLAKERVRYVDIDQALEDETPYLLFYQVMPIHVDPNQPNPPTYAEATEGWSDRHYNDIKDTALFDANRDIEHSRHEYADEAVAPNVQPPLAEEKSYNLAPGPTQRPTRISLDLPRPSQRRGRSSMSDANRNSMVDDASVVTEDPSISSTSIRTAPTTPMEDSRSGWLGGSRRGSKSGNGATVTQNGSFGKKAGSKSRPTSADKDSKRLSSTMSKLTARISRDKLKEQEPAMVKGPEVTVISDDVLASDAQDAKVKARPRPSKQKQRPLSKHMGAEAKNSDMDDQKCLLM